MKLTPYALLVIAATIAPLARADSTYPLLMRIDPAAIRAGTTTVCEVVSQKDLQPQQHTNVYGAYQVFVSGEGVIGRVLRPEIKRNPDPSKQAELPVLDRIKIALTVDSDALSGPREVRIATPRGSSTLAMVVVVRDPIIVEASNNNTLATAQNVSLPAALCGSIEKVEDVDVYKFSASEGSTATFNVHAARLQHVIHHLHEHCDPLLTLRSASGSILATSDNFFDGDPLLSFRFPVSGEYYLEIRDVRYMGSRDWFYSIEINSRPLAVTTYPLQVTPGQPARLLPLGFNLPEHASIGLEIPAHTPEGLLLVAPRLAGQPLSALPVVVSRLPQALEESGPNGNPATAQTIAVPAGVNGRIESPGDVDCFRFAAKKGQKLSFEIVAHRAHSPLDSFLRILNDKGVRQAQNDDMPDGRFHPADSQIESWAAPADGQYCLEVRDVNLQGGPTFTYFLKATPAEPGFRLDLDTDVSHLSPGAAAPIYVTAYRSGGFSGEIQLAITNLPPGVTATCGRILAGQRQGCIILQASDDATQAASNVTVTGSANIKSGQPRTLTALARPMQDTHTPGGGRGHWPVAWHNVSVNDPPDVRAVHVDRTSITLRPGQSQKINYTIERRPGFNYGVAVDAVFRHLETVYGDSLPVGVKVDDKASQLLLAGSQTQGSIVLVASPEAPPVERQLTAIVVHVALTFEAKYTLASEPIYISVAKPDETTVASGASP